MLLIKSVKLLLSSHYLLGSMYEKLGHDCCLSTGDVIKVVALEIKKILANNLGSEDVSIQSTTAELPLNFPGTVQYFSPLIRKLVSRDKEHKIVLK